VRARATIQNPEIAASMGIDTRRMYTLTFGLGAALAGLTGGLYAPTTTVVPTFGNGFIVEAFVTVIVGGANVLVGTPLAGAILGAVNSVLAGSFGTFIARVGLLIATILVIRLLPRGISGLVARSRT
jgi:branched-subunit amino acid ABC-type transport system permease component